MTAIQLLLSLAALVCAAAIVRVKGLGNAVKLLALFSAVIALLWQQLGAPIAAFAQIIGGGVTAWILWTTISRTRGLE